MSDKCDIDVLKGIVDEQRAQILNLEKKVNEAMRLAEDAENYSRQDCLILRGAVNVRQGVNLRSEVARLVQFHTGVKVEPWCINTVHWLKFGKSLIIRFNNKEVRNLIYSNRVPRDQTKRVLYIHESLTRSRVALVEMCVTMKKSREIHSYWTQNGQVYLKSEKDLPPIFVMPEWTLEEIRSKIAAQPRAYSEAVKARPKKLSNNRPKNP